MSKSHRLCLEVSNCFGQCSKEGGGPDVTGDDVAVAIVQVVGLQSLQDLAQLDIVHPGPFEPARVTRVVAELNRVHRVSFVSQHLQQN